MNKKRSFLIYGLCLCIPAAIVLFLSVHFTAEESILASWEDKAGAIADADADLYMDTISRADSYYRNESYAWFWYMANNDFDGLSFMVTGMERLDSSTMLVHINQKHRYAGEDFDFDYSVIYRREGVKWRDCDLDFLRKDIDGFRIYYMPDEKNLAAFTGFLLRSNEELTKTFGIGADENFPVKLYTDRELLRQRTYPIIERQFTAWGESNESLKIYTGHPTVPPYEGTVRHELVHHITLKLSGNRLCSWYAEGLAMYYGNEVIQGGDFIKTGRLTRDEAMRTIGMLEGVNAASMVDGKEITRYYGVSALIVRYIAEIGGDEAHASILKICGRDGYFDRAREKDPEAILQPLLHEAFAEVLGMSPEEISTGYVAWLKERY